MSYRGEWQSFGGRGVTEGLGCVVGTNVEHPGAGESFSSPPVVCEKRQGQVRDRQG